jgi:hypothetical protein
VDRLLKIWWNETQQPYNLCCLLLPVVFKRHQYSAGIIMDTTAPPCSVVRLVVVRQLLCKAALIADFHTVNRITTFLITTTTTYAPASETVVTAPAPTRIITVLKTSTTTIYHASSTISWHSPPPYTLYYSNLVQYPNHHLHNHHNLHNLYPHNPYLRLRNRGNNNTILRLRPHGPHLPRPTILPRPHNPLR